MRCRLSVYVVESLLREPLSNVTFSRWVDGGAGFSSLIQVPAELQPSAGSFGPVFVMRTRVFCGQGIGWRARAARRPARRSWRCHDSEPCDSRIGISSPGTRARPWRGFSRTDGCVGVAISTVGTRLRFRLYGPQNARCFRLPLLPVVGITLVAVH